MVDQTILRRRETTPAAGVPVADPDLRQLLAGLTAVRDGDFGTRLPEDADGLLGEIATVFNGMVDQLSLFTSEVTRVAREVGTEGQLGGQADVPGVSGTWKDLTDSVNAMAGNLTDQVRDIAEVATAVARGDLSQKITVDVRGEILELKVTINTMVDQLSSFADEVTRVAREVGSEGRLGGQAEVPGVAGTWRDLTDSVNFMAGNLTSQVRNIAQVTTAVARGDLSQKITHQHDGGPALVVRRRGDPGGPGGRHRRPARRAGPGQRRRRHLARPDRLGELDGRQPHRPGAQHRPGGHGGGPGRPPSTRWWTSSRRSPTR
ncbi:hypothetical protein GCM10027452_30940 [Micromonospora halotolerans]